MYNTPSLSILSLARSIFSKKNKSESDLSSPWLRNNKQKSIFFSRSSFAILYIIKIYKETINREPIIWLPDFFCNQPVELLENENCKIFYYKIGNDLNPDWNFCYKNAKKQKPDLFLLTHYFGILNDIKETNTFCKNHNAIFVEDAAHLLIPRGDVGLISDYTFYSIYKHIAIPDGSILISNKKNSKFIKNDFFLNSEILTNIKKKYCGNKNHLSWVLKKILQKIIPSYISFKFIKKGKISQNELIFAEISSLSKNIIYIEKKNIQNFSKKINQNFNFLSTSMSGKLSQITYNYKDDFRNPYWYIIDAKDISKKNIHDDINSYYNILRWVDLPQDILKHPRKNKSIIKRSMEFFYIPIHYSVKKSSLQQISKSIINSLNISSEINSSISEIKDESKWISLFNKIETPNLYQTSWYSSLRKLKGWKIFRGLIKISNNNFGIYQLLYKNFLGITIVRLNRGPLFFEKKISVTEKIESFKIIQKSIKSRGLKIFFMAPNLKNNFENKFILDDLGFLKRNIKPWGSSIVNLGYSEETLRNNLRSKWRNQLKSSEKNNLSFECSKCKSSLNFILEKYTQMTKEKKFKAEEPDFYLNLFNAQKNNFFILRVFKSQVCIASAIFLKNGNSSVYQIGWSNSLGRKFYAMNFLLWNGILEMKKNNIAFFDLGGINKNTKLGIKRFKQGINGTDYELIGEFFKIYI